MAKLTQLKDPVTQEKVYPITQTGAIVNDKGESLDGLLNEKQNVGNYPTISNEVPIAGVPSFPVVRYDEQNLTAEQKEQVQKNIFDGGPNRKLYETLKGVVFNEKTNSYDIFKEEGGITGVTEEQMAEVYKVSVPFFVKNAGSYQRMYNNANADAILSAGNTEISDNISDNAIKSSEMFVNSQKTEFIFLCNEIIVSNGFPISNGYEMFKNCYKLRKVIGFIGVSLCQSFRRTFIGCYKLESIKLHGLKADISFSESALLSVDDYTDSTTDKELSSLGFMVKYASNNGKDYVTPLSQPITITLHPEAFARVPESLKTKATNKNISIVSA